ncbi:MAG TPA: hypothetical protein IGR64_06135 [Leptolyngbyaceae cyanobacterium M65_K2018_010]|nr:hypothetical protein [Leptolyngbyaceae cyanobacterium M65_K2018_010]
MSIAQTTQLLQLVLNSALMLIIALAWWGVVVVRLATLTERLQRLPRSPYELRVRYRLNRHSALIMHYVLLILMASLCCLALRALISANSLITAALCLFVLATVGMLLSVVLALMEFYQLNGLVLRSSQTNPEHRPRALPRSLPQGLSQPPAQATRQQDVIAS